MSDFGGTQIQYVWDGFFEPEMLLTDFKSKSKQVREDRVIQVCLLK